MQTYPKPVGAYSAYVKAGEMLYISGQIALDSTTNALIQGGVREQTQKVLENIAAILKENGLTPQNIVKTSVFLASIDDFAAMNECYEAFFKDAFADENGVNFGENQIKIPFPARSAMAVKALPKGALIEIEAIAFFG